MSTKTSEVQLDIEEQNPQIRRAVKFLVERKGFKEITLENFLQITIQLVSIAKGSAEAKKEFIIQTINTMIDLTNTGNDEVFDPIFKTMVASVVPQFLDYALNIKVDCSSCLPFLKK